MKKPLHLYIRKPHTGVKNHSEQDERMPEKAGFTFEGFMKNNAVKNGKVLDMALYSLTRNMEQTVNGLRFTPMQYSAKADASESGSGDCQVCDSGQNQ